MGCSCGQCVGGVLSPKLLDRLSVTAASSHELIIDSLPEFHGDKPMHDPEVYLFDYLPPSLRLEVTRPFAVGFGNCAAAVAYLLKQRQLPKPRTVAQLAAIVPGLDKSATAAFLSGGGAAEFALDAVLGKAEAEHEQLGDGAFAQDDANMQRQAALPACRNDDQFDNLRMALFAESQFLPSGPYSWEDAAEENEADGDGWVHYDNSNWKPPAGANTGA